MRQRTCIVLILSILFVASGWLYAAGPASPTKQQGSDPLGQRPGEPPKTDPDLEKKLAKERAAERYRNLKRDSERLLVMATELKQQVDKSGENVLSMDVVKKCEEIERLAKSVRTKMRGD